jgi:hypothetical protein
VIGLYDCCLRETEENQFICKAIYLYTYILCFWECVNKKIQNFDYAGELLADFNGKFVDQLLKTLASHGTKMLYITYLPYIQETLMRNMEDHTVIPAHFLEKCVYVIYGYLLIEF